MPSGWPFLRASQQWRFRPALKAESEQRTAIEPSSTVPFAANVVTAEDRQCLHCGNCRAIELDFEESFCAVGKEVR